MRIRKLRSTDGFEEVRIEENYEKLVNMKETHPKIHVQPTIPEWGIPFALESVYVREDIANRLVRIAEDFPTDVHLLLWDGWRPNEVQQALFDKCVYQLTLQYPKLSLERLELKALEFVSRPSNNVLYPSTHSTGGAIDLTICYPDGEPYPMGTYFNELSDKAHTRYFELTCREDNTYTVAHNRRLLFSTMLRNGFTNFPNKWWHYDFGNQWWGIIKGENAKYGYIELE